LSDIASPGHIRCSGAKLVNQNCRPSNVVYNVVLIYCWNKIEVLFLKQQLMKIMKTSLSWVLKIHSAVEVSDYGHLLCSSGRDSIILPFDNWRNPFKNNVCELWTINVCTAQHNCCWRTTQIIVYIAKMSCFHAILATFKTFWSWNFSWY
jgi:hypothetical protein